jgi:hypothetical protein
MDGLYLKDSSAVNCQLMTLLERDHGILINRKRVRRVRVGDGAVSGDGAGAGAGGREAACRRGWHGRGRAPHRTALAGLKGCISVVRVSRLASGAARVLVSSPVIPKADCS